MWCRRQCWMFSVTEPRFTLLLTLSLCSGDFMPVLRKNRRKFASTTTSFCTWTAIHRWITFAARSSPSTTQQRSFEGSCWRLEGCERWSLKRRFHGPAWNVGEGSRSSRSCRLQIESWQLAVTTRFQDDCFKNEKQPAEINWKHNTGKRLNKSSSKTIVPKVIKPLLNMKVNNHYRQKEKT